MRLLKINDDGELTLTDDILDDHDIPPYAILSHTWQNDQEVTFDEFTNNSGKSKAGYKKIQFCAQQAERDGLRFFWVDTCCINKRDHIELQHAINSMFSWYKNAVHCYVYLSDVSMRKREAGSKSYRHTWEPAFRRSRWFTRGWTLQELLAPPDVAFYSLEGERLGDKKTLEHQVHEITKIAIPALRGSPLHEFSIEARFLWAKDRETTRKEDKVYSLLGIFGISMLSNYGEGQENALRRFHKEIKESSGNRPWTLDEKKKKLLLDSLHFDQIDSRQMSIRKAHTETCEWLLSRVEYVDWLDASKLSEHHGFLWIKGKPGTGKSTLMKFALVTAHKTMKDDTVISFFFNARGEGLEKSTIGTYRSLLVQLFKQLPALQSALDTISFASSSISSGYQWTVESLETLLEHAIEGLGDSSVVCFIDALDECEEQQIRDMIRFFERVGELTATGNIRLRVCFSSRHYPNIKIRKGLQLVLEGQEGHSQDITNYLESELRIGKTKIARQIRTELQDKASGIFVWIVLVVGILNKEYDSGRIHALRKRLQEIPSDLHELFRDILTRDSLHKDELLLCMQWVLFAKHPLGPEQLYLAIRCGVESEELSALSHEEVTKDMIKRFILDSSKGLVEFTRPHEFPWPNRQIAQFIHESVRDFLLKEDGLNKIWPDQRSNIQGQSHERLKQCCLKHINANSMVSRKFFESLPLETPPLVKSAAFRFPFLMYAVGNVLYHADLAEGGGITQEEFLGNFPLARWIELSNLFVEIEEYEHTGSMSLLYALAEQDAANLIRILPSDLSCLETGKERYGPPLFAAMANQAQKAFEALVKCLMMNRCPGSRFRESDDQTGYHLVKWQVLAPSFEFSRHKSILSHLSELGNTSLFSLILETGKVDVDEKDDDGQTPLSWAAQNEHDAIVELLLSTGKVDVNAKDRKSGLTPLHWAVWNENQDLAELLLETGQADVNAKEKERGMTPLSWAIVYGHEEIMNLLLETGQVDVNTKDKRGRTPLWFAAVNRNHAAVKLLLDAGNVDVNARDNRHHMAPLSCAAEKGSEAVVKLLLDTGKVNMNVKDNDGQTALLLAAKGGHEAVVRLLLNTYRVDINAQDNAGWTPLLWAVHNGHEAVVNLLVQYSHLP